MYIYMYVCVCVFIHTYMCIYVCVYICVYNMCVYIYNKQNKTSLCRGNLSKIGSINSIVIEIQSPQSTQADYMILYRMPEWDLFLQDNATCTDLPSEIVIDPAKTATYSEFLKNVPFSYIPSPTICNRIISSRSWKLVNIYHFIPQKNSSTFAISNIKQIMQCWSPLIYIPCSVLLMFLTFILCKIKVVSCCSYSLLFIMFLASLLKLCKWIKILFITNTTLK